VRKGLLQPPQLRERVIDRAVDRDPFPVRQEVYADEVDVLRELG